MNKQPQLTSVSSHLLEADLLEVLRDQYEQIQLMEAELVALRTDFDLQLTKVMLKRHLNVKQHAVCMNCGVIHNINNAQCACLSTMAGALLDQDRSLIASK